MKFSQLASALAAIVCLSSLIVPSQAVDLQWTNPGTGDWSDSQNWNLERIPGAWDNIFINNGGTAVKSDGELALSHLRVGHGGTGYLILDGGKVSASDNWSDNTVVIGGRNGGVDGYGRVTVNDGGELTSWQDIRVGFNGGGKGELVLNSGTVKSGWQIFIGAGTEESVVHVDGGLLQSGIDQGGDIYVGGADQYTGKGRLNIGGDGHVNSLWNIYVGRLNGSSGVISITDSGHMEMKNALVVGHGGEGTVNLSENGTITQHGYTYIGYDAGSRGTINVSGGKFDAEKHVYVGINGAGTLNVTGGEVAISGAAVMGSYAGSTGNINLDGGVLETAVVGKGAGNGKLSFDGGTLRAGANAGADFIGNIGTIDVKANGGTVDTNGKTITIASGFSGVGTLSKTGAGSLTLAASSTLGGLTHETDTLILTAGHTLDLTGAMHIASNTVFRMEGSSTSNAFVNVGDTLTLGGGSTLVFDPTYSLIETGTLALDFSASSADINVTLLDFEGLAAGEMLKILGYTQLEDIAYGTGFDADRYFNLTNGPGYLFTWVENDGLYLTTVPEPATCALLLAGLAGVVVMAVGRHHERR